jgi:hypothetical protein
MEIIKYIKDFFNIEVKVWQWLLIMILAGILSQ